MPKATAAIGSSTSTVAVVALLGAARAFIGRPVNAGALALRPPTGFTGEEIVYFRFGHPEPAKFGESP